MKEQVRMKTFMVQVWAHSGQRYKEVGVTNAVSIEEIVDYLMTSGFRVVNRMTGSVVFLRNEKEDLVIIYECAVIPAPNLASRLSIILALS
jgi:hypothetical protein